MPPLMTAAPMLKVVVPLEYSPQYQVPLCGSASDVTTYCLDADGSSDEAVQNVAFGTAPYLRNTPMSDRHLTQAQA